MLVERPLGLHFTSVRVGYADNDLLKMLKQAGCSMVSLGIELGRSRDARAPQGGGRGR